METRETQGNVPNKASSIDASTTTTAQQHTEQCSDSGEDDLDDLDGMSSTWSLFVNRTDRNRRLT